MLLAELRRKHPKFIYQSFETKEESNQLSIRFHFLLEPDINFSPEISLPLKQSLNQKGIENFAFHLGLVETISYWKAACSPEILISAGRLTNQQISWWHDLFIHGLGEFFYDNKIDFTSPHFLQISSNQNKEFNFPLKNSSSSAGDLILVGGGKDSPVALELLKNLPSRKGCLVLNPTRASLENIQIAHYPAPLVVKRKIDPKLIKLNQLGYLNGHTPFSAYLAFLGVFVGVLHRYKNIVVANDRSADEENVIFRHLKVNHQYSKGFRFERLFQDYCQRYLTAKVQYFSFLRPLYEIQISQLFASYPQYHLSFRSCNLGQKENSWCGHCPKCAFVYLSLFPFLPFEKMMAIFGEDYYRKAEIKPFVYDLVGLGKRKPFECVGTKKESILAVALALRQYRTAGRQIPPLLLSLEKKLKLGDLNLVCLLEDEIQKGWNDKHFLPPKYSKLLKKSLGQSFLILGYGREGKSTHRYLVKHYPGKKIAIADRQEIKPIIDSPTEIYSGRKCLQSLCRYDVIIRSPGVSLQLPELQKCLQSGKKLTSATNIFFSECQGMVIGITGTKGKSTTASLIAHILKEKYSDVRLVGNIGRPALDYLPGSNRKTVFVAELSSFQLEDIDFSPHLVVLLNIVPEHLDRYQNFSQYLEAKRRIFCQQTAKDILVFNPSHQIVNKLTLNSPARKYHFSLTDKKTDCYLDKENVFVQKKDSHPWFVLPRQQIPLLGEGNIENALAAICVGLILKVPLEKIRQAIAEFKPLKHRLEFVGEYQGIKFYNDSLATIPEATIHALKALGEDVETLIAGGYERNLDFTALGIFLGKRGLKALILFPPTGKRIWQALIKATAKKELRPQKYDVTSMEEAVKIAFEITSPGKICLLSPASASFGRFRDYQERGNLFKQLVKKS